MNNANAVTMVAPRFDRSSLRSMSRAWFTRRTVFGGKLGELFA